jgi:hypothetical protein
MPPFGTCMGSKAHQFFDEILLQLILMGNYAGIRKGNRYQN